MGTNVSGIARAVLQARADMKISSAAEESREDMAVNFMQLMNQNTLSSEADISADSKRLEMVTDTENTTQNAYDTYKKPAKSVSVKERTSLSDNPEDAIEPIDEFEEKIRKVLKEELGVTDEQISVAMENLGLSLVELNNLQNLALLVQTLTGEDVGTLFLSESFQTVMQEVSVLTDELCAELGITKEELETLCQEWEQIKPEVTWKEESAIASEQTPEEVLNVETEKDADAVEVLSEQPAEAVDDATESTDKTTDLKHQSESAEPVVIQTKEEASEALTETNQEDIEQTKVTEIPEQVTTQAEAGEDKGFQDETFEHSQDAKQEPTANSAASVSGQQTVVREEFAIPQENHLSHTNQVDAMELIQQIAKNVRVTISTTNTSMEMQLNPEHLGKIYLNVSERDGVVRAQIATQTEAVREALETQLVELRQTLNQHGVKVDAVEVTVATHEFEQSLDGNAKQEEQTQRQMEETTKQARRNLNLDELDGLSGLMSEEERLAAKIMRDNGNQVDLTA